MGNRQTLRRFTPVFTYYTTTHEESTSGLLGTQDELMVAAAQVHSLTTSIYNQVTL